MKKDCGVGNVSRTQNRCRQLRYLLMTVIPALFMLTLLCSVSDAAETTETTVTIQLDAAGGTCADSEITAEESGRVGTLPKARKSGCVFLGWYTQEEGGSRVKAGTEVSELLAEQVSTLYARWDARTYTIRFKANKVLDRAPKKMICRIGKRYVLPGADDPAIGSWNTRKDGTGTTYLPGQKIKNLSTKKGKTVTLYASAFYGKNNVEKLVRYFVRIGYTKEAAAAICGNLMYESGGGYNDIKLNAVEYATGRGIGMVQWTDTSDYSRRTWFEQYCASRGKPWPNKDLKVQVDYLMEELSGTYGKIWKFGAGMGYPKKYKMSLKRFRKCTDLQLAVGVFCACFERPYAQGCGLSTRLMYAKNAIRYVS